MRKRMSIVLLLLCMLAGLCACGKKGQNTIAGEEGQEFAQITIAGETYNLNSDFDKVIKKMVKNDVNVGTALYSYKSLIYPYVFNRDGILEKAEEHKDTYVFADYAPANSFNFNVFEGDCGDLAIKHFEINGNVEFKMASGIGGKSDTEALKVLEGYVEMDGNYGMSKDTYGALYADGEFVDLSQYEDKYEEWKNELSGEGDALNFWESLEKYLPNHKYYFVYARLLNMEGVRYNPYLYFIEKECEEKNIPLKNEMLTYFAMHDAGERLEKGEIDSYTLIKYTITEGNEMRMTYIEYSLDKDCDMERYNNIK